MTQGHTDKGKDGRLANALETCRLGGIAPSTQYPVETLLGWLDTWYSRLKADGNVELANGGCERRH